MQPRFEWDEAETINATDCGHKVSEELGYQLGTSEPLLLVLHQ